VLGEHSQQRVPERPIPQQTHRKKTSFAANIDTLVEGDKQYQQSAARFCELQPRVQVDAKADRNDKTVQQFVF